MNSKPRVIKNYDKLSEQVLNQIRLKYPYGFEKYLIRFKNAKGSIISALPFEGEDRHYLVRMTIEDAQRIIAGDHAYDEFGKLKKEAKAEIISNFDDLVDDIEDELDVEEIPGEPSEM